MKRPILFFLGVFCIGLVGLVYVSGDLERWLGNAPAAKEPSPTGRTAAKKIEPAPNEVKIPIFDPKEGRLLYTFRARHDDSAMEKLADIQSLDSLTLYDGSLEVPIYEDIADDIPTTDPNKKPRVFVLTFATAEYKATRSPTEPGALLKGGTEGREILLRGGGGRGEGRIDDGTTFRFEELVLKENRGKRAEEISYIRSDKPVSIQNGYLRLESPSGFEGRILKNKGLDRMEFFPPVRTYLDPRAGELFALGEGQTATDSVVAGIASPRPKTEPAKIAIRCEGPMAFELDREPKTIRFEKDVVIYPVSGAVPDIGAPPPPPGPTQFLCQLLTFEIDATVSPPAPRRAVASWEGGRVRAIHLGKVIEGDQLVWTLPAQSGKNPPAVGAPQPRGSAVLTGKPLITSEEGNLETGEILFLLDDNRILLKGGLQGDFVAALPATPPARTRERDEKPQRRRRDEPAGAKDEQEKKKQSLPERWKLNADEGELVFRSGEEGSAEAFRPPQGGASFGTKSLSRLTARSAKPGALEIASQDGGQYRLRGRTLVYDARNHIVDVEEAEGLKTQFFHGQDKGSSRAIRLRIDEGLVILRGDVEIEARDFQKLVAREGQDKTKSGDVIDGPIELSADEATLQFDSDKKLLGWEARAAKDRRVSVRSLGSNRPFCLTGEVLTWDHVRQVVTVGASDVPPAGDDAPELPQLEIPHGSLRARTIRFDRKSWRAYLDEEVAIRGVPERPESQERAEASPAGNSFEMLAGRAEVDLTENFEPPEDGSVCGASKEMAVVKEIRAWAAPGRRIDFKSRCVHGRASEAVWTARPGELRVRGEGRQELFWNDSGKEGAFTAQEIVYSCDSQTVVATGEVKGTIRLADVSLATLDPSRVGKRPREPEQPVGSGPHPHAEGLAPAAHKPSVALDGPKEALVFDLETSRVEAIVRDTDSGLELVTLRAREKVLVLNERYGLTLTGDDLVYDPEHRELRVFSEAGRPQTLTRTRLAKVPVKDSRGKTMKEQEILQVDQIDAQEIQVRADDNAALPLSAEERTAGTVIVKFIEKVTATYHAPMENKLLRGDRNAEMPKEWKLHANYLAARLLPQKERKDRPVELALAEGNVIFSSLDYIATAQEAIYEEESRKLTLKGDAQRPVRLNWGTKQVSNPEISLWPLGDPVLQMEMPREPRNSRPDVKALRRAGR